MQPLSLRSPSGTEIIRARLLKCLQERCADFKSQGTMSAEQLAQVLGVKPHDEARVQLSWPGKGKALGKALSACGQTLWPRPELSWSRSDHQPSANMYLEGDNLEALKLLGLSYSGAVKVIYIDPPYNTGKDFVYRDDRVQSPEEYARDSGEVAEVENADADCIEKKVLLRMRVNKETDGRFHSNWCTLMYPRLLLARQLLRTDGVIFISIDDYEQQNLKLLCDEVFGADNLVTQLVWQRAYSPKNDAKFVSTSHDYVLMYAYDRAAFAQSLRAQGLSCDFSQGQLLTYTMVGHSQEGTQELKVLLQDGVFDGPKPVRLIKHLLRVAGLKSHDHELVLDFFSGSATTAQAVWDLNAEDGGNRRFIMVQLPEQSKQDQRAHANHSFATICDIGRARIRAVAAKLAAKLNLTLPPMDCTKIVRGGGDSVDVTSSPASGASMAPLLEPSAPLDLGLQVFTLTALPPLAGSLPSEQSYQSELLTAGPDRSSIEYKALTWLYCLIARLQLPFTGRLSTKIIAGFKVWCYGPDLLWLCPQANLVLSQAWIDALSNESSWPQFVAVRSDVLTQHQDVAFLLAELFKAITVVPFTDEEAV